jgi:hypothetical protein
MKEAWALFNWFLRGISLAADGGTICMHFKSFCIAGKQLVCIFTWYSLSFEATCLHFLHFYVVLHSWEATCIHFYMVFVQLGNNLSTFLCGIRIAGTQLLCICTWYLLSWEATCLHFYVVFA